MPYPLVATAQDSKNPCSKLDPAFRLQDYTSPGYAAKLDAVIGCLSRIVKLIRRWCPTIDYLRDTQARGTGLNYLSLMIQLAGETGFTEPELAYVSNAWLGSLDSGLFYRFMDLLPLGISTDFGSPSGPVARPLIDWISQESTRVPGTGSARGSRGFRGRRSRAG